MNKYLFQSEAFTETLFFRYLEMTFSDKLLGHYLNIYSSVVEPIFEPNPNIYLTYVPNEQTPYVRCGTMEAIEFKTRIKNGIIQIPRKYSQKVGNTVKVIILTEHKSKHVDMIDELLKQPVKIPDFKPFSRADIYDRS